METSDEIVDRIKKIEQKYAAMGQDMPSYLDGLLYANSLTYWDYIHLDTLLNLQKPRTDFPDERIFISYHQITELYFQLILLELDQLKDGKDDLKLWHKIFTRVNCYFKHLCQSFEIMTDNLDKDQFLKFRMALLPASGFQSAQYRKIEIVSTDIINLCHHSQKAQLQNIMDLEKCFANLYWKSGNIELKTGQKTLTLEQFETKYDPELITLVKDHTSTNIAALYRSASKEIQKDETLKQQLRDYDLFSNVFWPLSHYKSAVKHLMQKPDIIAATGGTNWQEFLPPKFQKIMFFPNLWTEEEIADWGKPGILKLLNIPLD